MPDSFYQALLIFIPIALVIVWGLKRMRPNFIHRVKKDIQHRLFAESPTFVVEDMHVEKSTGGFYTFRVEGLVAGLTDGSLEVRIVEGTHSGTAFLAWNYQKPDELDLKPEYAELYKKP